MWSIIYKNWLGTNIRQWHSACIVKTLTTLIKRMQISWFTKQQNNRAYLCVQLHHFFFPRRMKTKKFHFHFFPNMEWLSSKVSSELEKAILSANSILYPCLLSIIVEYVYDKHRIQILRTLMKENTTFEFKDPPTRR